MISKYGCRRLGCQKKSSFVVHSNDHLNIFWLMVVHSLYSPVKAMYQHPQQGIANPMQGFGQNGNIGGGFGGGPPLYPLFGGGAQQTPLAGNQQGIGGGIGATPHQPVITQYAGLAYDRAHLNTKAAENSVLRNLQRQMQPGQNIQQPPYPHLQQPPQPMIHFQQQQPQQQFMQPMNHFQQQQQQQPNFQQLNLDAQIEQILANLPQGMSQLPSHELVKVIEQQLQLMQGGGIGGVGGIQPPQPQPPQQQQPLHQLFPQIQQQNHQMLAPPLQPQFGNPPMNNQIGGLHGGGLQHDIYRQSPPAAMGPMGGPRPAGFMPAANIGGHLDWGGGNHHNLAGPAMFGMADGGGMAGLEMEQTIMPRADRLTSAEREDNFLMKKGKAYWGIARNGIGNKLNIMGIVDIKEHINKIEKEMEKYVRIAAKERKHVNDNKLDKPDDGSGTGTSEYNKAVNIVEMSLVCLSVFNYVYPALKRKLEEVRKEKKEEDIRILEKGIEKIKTWVNLALSGSMNLTDMLTKVIRSRKTNTILAECFAKVLDCETYKNYKAKAQTLIINKYNALYSLPQKDIQRPELTRIISSEKGRKA